MTKKNEKGKYIQMRTKGNNVQAITCQGYQYIILFFFSHI